MATTGNTDSLTASTPALSEGPWPVSAEVQKIVHRGRLIERCPTLKRVGAPYWTVGEKKDTLPATSAGDSASSAEGPNNDPSPLDLLARVLGRFRSPGRPTAQPGHYICVLRRSMPIADTTAVQSDADEAADDLPILERLRRRLSPEAGGNN